MSLIILAAAALASQCPADVGATNRSEMSRIDSEITAGNYPIYQLKTKRLDWLAEKVKLGYAQKDAGCTAEARKTFEEVWSWNNAAYASVAYQAREALNSMLK